MTDQRRVSPRRGGLGAAAFGFAALLGTAAPGLADDDGRAEALRRCSAIEQDEARLACFDAVSIVLDRKTDGADREAEQIDREAEDVNRERARLEAERARRALEMERLASEQAARARQLELEEQAALLARREQALAAEQARIEAEARAMEEAAQDAARRGGEEVEEAGDGSREINSEPADPVAAFGANDLPADDSEDRAEEDLDEVTLPVERYRFANTGKLVLFLENGQVWRQKDGPRIHVGKKGIETVRLRKGWVGSHFMQVNGTGRQYRAERLR